MKFPLVVISASISLALLGCGGDDTTAAPTTVAPTTAAPDPPGPATIVETAKNTPALSSLVAALEAANLVDKLNGAGPFTVFAPTNDAFATAQQQERFADLLNPDNKTLLTYVLKQHVLEGKIQSTDLKEGANANESLNRRETLQITLSGGAVTVITKGTDADETAANVSQADIECTNGVVHVVDSVIVPSTVRNILQLAQQTEGLETLAQLIVDNGLSSELAGSGETLTGEVTVFAPINAAWSRDNAGQTEEARFRALGDEARKNGLLFHVFGQGIAFATDIPDGDDTFNLTMADNKLLTMTRNGNAVTFRDGNSEASVATADVRATNGVVHLVDRVLQSPSGLIFA